MVVLALAALALLAGRQPAFAADAATPPAVKPRADLVVAPDVQENLPPVSPEAAVAIAHRPPQGRTERRRPPHPRPHQLTR